MSLTNLVILASTVFTNTHKGNGLFKQMDDKLIGIRDVQAVIQETSIGYMDGTNKIELAVIQKLLSAKTNWWELPITVGVQLPASPDTPAPLTLKSNNATIKPSPSPVKAEDEDGK
jgi:hypothetical protein